MPDPQPDTEGVLRSIYASDPELAELLELFVEELPDRIEAFQDAYRAAQAEVLARLAHQLKGAAPGYGYPTIGEAAGKIEHRLKASQTPEVEQVAAEVDELIRLCRRAMVVGD